MDFPAPESSPICFELMPRIEVYNTERIKFRNVSFLNAFHAGKGLIRSECISNRNLVGIPMGRRVGHLHGGLGPLVGVGIDNSRIGNTSVRRWDNKIGPKGTGRKGGNKCPRFVWRKKTRMKQAEINKAFDRVSIVSAVHFRKGDNGIFLLCF